MFSSPMIPFSFTFLARQTWGILVAGKLPQVTKPECSMFDEQEQSS